MRTGVRRLGPAPCGATSCAARRRCGKVRGVSPDLDERLSVAATLNLTELVNLGCELAEVGRLPDAEQCFRQASDGGSGAAAFNLGNCLAEQERWLEAVAAYEV